MSDSVPDLLNRPPVTYCDPGLDRVARELDARLKREYEKLSLELKQKERHPSVNTNIALFHLPDSSHSSTTVDCDEDSDSSSTDVILDRCFNLMCQADEEDIYPNTFKKCTRCHIAMYCDRKCQKEHWPLHRAFCGKIDKLPDFP